MRHPGGLHRIGTRFIEALDKCRKPSASKAPGNGYGCVGWMESVVASLGTSASDSSARPPSLGLRTRARLVLQHPPGLPQFQPFRPFLQQVLLRFATRPQVVRSHRVPKLQPIPLKVGIQT